MRVPVRVPVPVRVRVPVPVPVPVHVPVRVDNAFTLKKVPCDSSKFLNSACTTNMHY